MDLIHSGHSVRVCGAARISGHLWIRLPAVWESDNHCAVHVCPRILWSVARLFIFFLSDCYRHFRALAPWGSTTHSAGSHAVNGRTTTHVIGNEKAGHVPRKWERGRPAHTYDA